MPAGPLDVLELGCGTGVDALWLSRRGHRVLATDASNPMLAEARARPGAEAVRFSQLDLRELSARTLEDERFDLVFSDFGALNLLAPGELPALAAACAGVLRPGGRAILVVMPRVCLWELLVFGACGRWAQARRRSSGPLLVPVAGQVVTTHYHAPRDIVRAFGPAFVCRGTAPIGLLVPPSFLSAAARVPRLVAMLGRADQALARLPGLAAWADHALIDLALVG